jgi:ribosomal-protein-alanine N-acetyltransferase
MHRMPYRFEAMDAASAEAISRWRYGGELAIYDGDPGEVDALLHPANRYLAGADEDGALAGFACLGADARVPGFAYSEDALDVGVGLRPDLVGRGRGLRFLRDVLELARRTDAPEAFRVTVASFNARALRVCVALGFREVARFTSSDDTAFVVLRRAET